MKEAGDVIENERKHEGASEEAEEQGSLPYYDKRPELGKNGPSKLRQRIEQGMTYLIVIAVGILFYFAMFRLGNLSKLFVTVVDILKPIIYGMAIAYLLNPIVKKVDKYLVPVLEKKLERKKAKKLSRAAGVLLSLILLIVLVIALLNMLLPELFSSIRSLVYTLPGQLADLVEKISKLQDDRSTTGILVKNILEQGSGALENWLKNDLLAQTNALMSGLTIGVISFLKELMNVVIGLIVSTYVLFSKEIFSSQCKKIVYALLRTDHANMTLHLVKKSNEIFGGFIIGKIIDSAIIGVLCFVGLSILDMPYVLLVSVIVGVTNVIPFFGPYIGAIPSAVLILLEEPVKGVYFILFILVLQQLDGNVIGPKILGNSTGLSAFWVVFSILLGGGLFGFVGMIMGVPTFAVIYYIVMMLINHRLEKKNLPTLSESYGAKSYVDDNGTYVRRGEE